MDSKYAITFQKTPDVDEFHLPIGEIVDGSKVLDAIEKVGTEWGDPKDKDSYFYMLSYSPYDQVEEKDYPAIFITTGYHDSQVQYFEPAKWIARLRDRRTNKEPLLMYCNMDAGHGGASGRFEAFKETAMEYAFLISLTE